MTRKKGTSRDTSEASKVRTINHYEFLKQNLLKELNWVFDQQPHAKYFVPETGKIKYTALARHLTEKQIATPTGKEKWSDQSAKRYWNLFISIVNRKNPKIENEKEPETLSVDDFLL